MKKWENLIENIEKSHDEIRIALVGKYVGLEDAYYSLNEALKCAGFAQHKKVKIEFIEAESIEKK